MSAGTPGHRPTIPAPSVVLREDVCDRFEAAWRGGGRPRIEDHLGDPSAPGGSTLLADLLIIELAYRARRGEWPVEGEYRARFPGQAEAVRDAFESVPTPPPAAGAPDPLATTAASPARRDAGATPTGEAGSRFRVLRLLARGGLGEVFVARDEELCREVVLKAMQARHADDPEGAARFLREAEITGRLEHPGVVPVYGLGKYEDGRPFYAMRLIRGESLKEAVERLRAAEPPGGDPSGRARGLRGLLRRFVDVCDAIAYAHSRGVLHRDLKPANIMLGPFGETLVVDWGLAKVAGRPDGAESATATAEEAGAEATLRPESGGDAGETLPDTRLGTPAYMSPEQAAGAAERVGPASDVYGLGATLYHVLTGRPPFDGADVFAALQRARDGDFRPPAKVDRAVPPPLEAVCLKAMALDPDDRYPTPRALADDVERWLADEPVSAYREPAAIRLGRRARRHRSAVAAAAALLVTATAALAISTALVGREAARREEHRLLAEENFAHARDAVDRMLTEVAEVDLADVPQMHAVRRTLLARAREFYRGSLARRGGDPAFRREAGRAHVRLGEIDDQLGDHAAAEHAYRAGLEILAALARERPAWDDARRDLARGEDGLGTLLKKANRFRESEAALRSALARRERLARDHPDDEDDRQALAEGRYHLAVLLSRLRGRRPEDEEAYREALRVQGALVDGSRGRPEHRRALARSLNNLGLLLAATGRPDEAEADYREAVAILEGLVARDPPTAGDRWQLARAYGNLAMLLRAGGQAAEAEPACLKARGLQEALAADFPGVPDYRHELAAIGNNLGLLRDDAGRHRDAEASFREALAIQEGLAADAPRRADFRHALAVTRLNLAATLERNDPGAAVPAYREALADQERLAADFPEVPEYQRALGRTLYSLARVLLAGGDAPGARGHLARAIRYHRAGLASDPRDRSAREFLRDDYGVLCLALIRAGDLAEAAVAAEELPRIVPDGRESLRAAAFLARCAATAPADDYGRRAVEVLRRAVERGLITDPGALHSPELDPLRPRDDFRRLDERLGRRAPPRDG